MAVDNDGEITVLNDSAQELLGLPTTRSAAASTTSASIPPSPTSCSPAKTADGDAIDR